MLIEDKLVGDVFADSEVFPHKIVHFCNIFLSKFLTLIRAKHTVLTLKKKKSETSPPTWEIIQFPTS